MSGVDCIYFFDVRADGAFVRIGFDGSSRIAQHRSVGQKLLCAMRGTKDFEGRLHGYFTDQGHLAKDGFAGSKSVYHGQEIHSYVRWLIERGVATPDEALLEHFTIPTWDAIDPAEITDYWYERSGQTSFQRTTLRDRRKITHGVAYHRSASDEWFTPIEIINTARTVLGEIDLDPASCPAANLLVRATSFYSQQLDGLLPTHRWSGRVWMNPPYGDLAPKFANKLIAEFRAGKVSAAIALFNANTMSSQWFEPLYAVVRSMIVTRGRLAFKAGSEGQRFSSPSTGSVIVYLGPTPDIFAQHFRKHGNVLIPEAAVAGDLAQTSTKELVVDHRQIPIFGDNT